MYFKTVADPGFCMGGWPDGLKKCQGAQRRENFLGPSRGVWGHASRKF